MWLFPPQSSADKQKTGTKMGLRGSWGEQGDWPAQKRTGIQPVTHPVDSHGCIQGSVFTPVFCLIPHQPCNIGWAAILTLLTEGETEAEKRTRLCLGNGSNPSPLAWGWLWELAACKGGDSFAAGTLGSLGLTGKPSGPGTDQVPALGLGSRSLPRRKASDQPVWRPGGLGSLSPDLRPLPSLPHLSRGQECKRMGPADSS